jgi:CHASE2 domain-containing sensor protein
MSKFLDTWLDILHVLAKRYLPPIYRLIRYWMDIKSLSFTWVAHFSRRFGARAIVMAGILASAYAVYLFVIAGLSPGAPKASHDVILKTRLSSPLPSNNIVIVDIDERTLAALSEAHGRWPWSRDVLADGIQKIFDEGSRAVLFNILLSDPDKRNPDADAVMEVTAQLNRPIAFPLIRLNPQNDIQSQLLASSIVGMTPSKTHSPDQTVAVILPMFSSMYDRLGVANQRPDADGIVRKYPIRWTEATYTLPSLVQQTAELGGVNLSGIPDTISLNWRNKQGRYTRISFSDLILDQLEQEQKSLFQNSYVVLSLSAPGLGQTKPTSVAAVEDDGEILATALDDVLHKTYLRTIPTWVTFLLNLLAIWGLVWFSVKPFQSSWFNKGFLLLQSGLGSVTLLSASYTNYLIDLSDSMSFGLMVFAAIKLIQSMDDRWSRARPGFRRWPIDKEGGQVLVLGYLKDHFDNSSAKALQQAAERIVGFNAVIRVDDLFGGETFIKSTCSSFSSLLIHVYPEHRAKIEPLVEDCEQNGVVANFHNLEQKWDTENQSFSSELAPLVLQCAAMLLQKEWSKPTSKELHS